MNTDSHENTKHRFMSRVSDTFSKAVNKAVESLGIRKENPGNIKHVESPRIVKSPRVEKKADDVKEWIKDPEVKKIKLQDFMAACGYFPEKADCDDLEYFNLPLIRKNENITDDVTINTRGNYFDSTALNYWYLFSFDFPKRKPDIAALACLVLGSNPEDVEADIKRKMQEFKDKPVKEPDRVLMTTENVNLLKKCENPYREYCNSIKPCCTSIYSGDPQKLPSDILELYKKKERAYEDGLNYSFSDRIDPNVSSSLTKARCEADTEYHNSLMQDMVDTVKGIIMDLSEGRLYYDPIKDQCLAAEQFLADSRPIPERTAELDKWIRKNRFSLEVGLYKIDYMKLAKKSHEVLVQKWKTDYVENFKNTDLYPYLNSMREPHNLLSGNSVLLPKDLYELFNTYLDESEEYHILSHQGVHHPDTNEQYTKLRTARQEFLAEFESQLEALSPSIVSEPEVHYGKDINNGNSNINNKTDMANKKTEEAPDSEKMKVTEEKKQKTKREPQIVTSNGDLVTYAHWFKPEGSDELFFMAKVNGIPLRARHILPEDVEKINNGQITCVELFEKYYPTKMAPRYTDDAFKFPQKIQTSLGEMNVEKYNVYKNKDERFGPLSAYMLFAKIDGKNMSIVASQDDLDNYFDHTRHPKDQIIQSFGAKLGLAEHYEQFKLPEGVNLPDKCFHIDKQAATNARVLNVTLPDGSKLHKTLEYADTNAFFNKKATLQQLGAKYFGGELSKMNLQPAQKQELQKSMAMK